MGLVRGVGRRRSRLLLRLLHRRYVAMTPWSCFCEEILRRCGLSCLLGWYLKEKMMARAKDGERFLTIRNLKRYRNHHAYVGDTKDEKARQRQMHLYVWCRL